MADMVIMQDSGYTIAQTDEAETAVPYGSVDHHDGTRNNGFIDLRDRPELAATIPEAQASVGMQAILQAVNARGFRFMTLGCERGLVHRDPMKDKSPHY